MSRQAHRLLVDVELVLSVVCETCISSTTWTSENFLKTNVWLYRRNDLFLKPRFRFTCAGLANTQILNHHDPVHVTSFLRLTDIVRLWLKASEALTCSDNSLASNTRHQPTPTRGKRSGGGTNLIPWVPRSMKDQTFPSLKRLKFSTGVNQALASGALACDPETFDWTLIHWIPIQQM